MLANYCNITTPDYHLPRISDLYTIIYREFIKFLNENQYLVFEYVQRMAKNSKVYNIKRLDMALNKVYELLKLEKGPITRKLLKSIIMPYCYNVTVYKASNEVDNKLIEKGFIFGGVPVAYLLTKLIFWFIELKFTKIVNLKDLLSKIGELAALFGLSVYWGIGDWAEVSQQYMSESNEKVAISVKEGNTTKRSGFKYKKNLFICDKLKAKKATPANQIHSIDAHVMYIMMHDLLFNKKVPCAGIHDCVVTTWLVATSVSTLYYNTLYQVLNDPKRFIDLLIVNTFSTLIPNHFLKDGVYDISGFLSFLSEEDGKIFLEKKFFSKTSNRNLSSLEAEKQRLSIEMDALSKQLKTARGKNALHIKYLLESYTEKQLDIKNEIIRTKGGLSKVYECLTQVIILYNGFVSFSVTNNTVIQYMSECKDDFKKQSMF